MAEALMTRCTNCGRAFASRLLQIDKVSWQTTTFTNNGEPCPYCGTSLTLNKEDMFFGDPETTR